ncbi:hypothetical protein MMC31_004823, partial [Peltigera leucophlebia]|nr:hypothetical protein [Peltigera leucophlebia]
LRVAEWGLSGIGSLDITTHAVWPIPPVPTSMSRRTPKPTASSTPDSSATLQVPSTMTQEQNEQIFELTRQKLEAEMATAEEDARLRRAAAEEESKLRRELTVSVI